MFQLTQASAKLTYINPRIEKHGDENAGAADIGIEMSIGSDVLDDLARGLKGMIYKKPAAQQTELIEGAPATDDGPQLRFGDAIDRFKFKKEYAGYAVRLVWGDLAGSVKVKIDDINVCKFIAEPKNGGTVELRFQIQSHPSPEQTGDLFQMLGREVTICLVPPGVDFV